MFGYTKEDFKSDLRWLKRFLPIALVAGIATLLGEALAVLTVKGINNIFDL